MKGRLIVVPVKALHRVLYHKCKVLRKAPITTNSPSQNQFFVSSKWRDYWFDTKPWGTNLFSLVKTLCKKISIGSTIVCSSDLSVVIIISLTCWWMIKTQTQCVPLAPARTHSLGRSYANFEKPASISGNVSLKSLQTSYKPSRTKHFCTSILFPSRFKLTVSFFPGSSLLVSSLR